jgi:Protein of unknown function (DUF3349)
VALPAPLQKVFDWLHAGYPTGIPQTDYYPLLAFLARSLRPDEVSEVVSTLEAESLAGHQTRTADVRTAIQAVTNSPALGQDVQRIEHHLRDLGWALESARDH